MTTTRTLFDAELAEDAKRDGMAKAAANRATLLRFARTLAVMIARGREDRTCTADDVQLKLVESGYTIFALGNAAGSLFRGKQWRATGRFIKSERVHAHSNRIAVWEYVGESTEAN